MNIYRAKIIMKLTTNLISFLGRRLRNTSFLGLVISLSHSHHDFAVSFFDTKIWPNAWQKFIESFASQIGLIYISSIKMFSFLRNNFFPEMHIKKFGKPFHNFYIDGSEFKNCSVMSPRFSRRFNGVDVKTTIAINVASQITKIKFIIHIDSFSIVYKNIEYKSTVNDLAREIRKDMRKSELYGDIESENRRILAA